MGHNLICLNCLKVTRLTAGACTFIERCRCNQKCLPGRFLTDVARYIVNCCDRPSPRWELEGVTIDAYEMARILGGEKDVAHCKAYDDQRKTS